MTSCIFLDKGGVMKKIVMSIAVLLMFVCGFCSDEAVTEERSEVVVQAKKVIKKETVKEPLSLERKLFVNYLDSPMAVSFVDKNNKQCNYVIPAGVHRGIDCVVAHLKKVTYFDRHQEKIIAIPVAKLQENAVIIFNLDSKLEFFNFVNIQQKQEMIKKTKAYLQKVRFLSPWDKVLIEKLVKKVEDLAEQTIYKQ